MTEESLLILLVGSNPLPNYLAVTVLNPRAIRLLYTQETERPMGYLRTALERIGHAVDARCVSAADPGGIREALSGLPSHAHLNYTGGTKVMAAHARMVFREAGGGDERASYVDERAGVLRHDHGVEIPLARGGAGLTFDLIAELHGCAVAKETVRNEPLPGEEDATLISSAVLRNVPLAKRLYEEGSRLEDLKTSSRALTAPFEPGSSLAGLSVPGIPAAGWPDDTFKAWWRFLKGDWLELQMARWVRSLTGAPPRQGVHCTLPGGRQFEVDVAFVRGHRFFLASCTTNAGLSLCKSKLFEVAMRARQLGGDLARSALVCLLDGADSKGPLVAQLRNDVESVWDAANTPRVFGAADLREWSGLLGRPDITTLREWLDS